MKRKREGEYIVAQNESVQIRIERRGINLPASVALDGNSAQSADGKLYVLRITGNEVSHAVVTAAFPFDAPDDAAYQIFVEEPGGQSFEDRTIEKSDDPVTWQHDIRFIIGQ